MKYVCSVCGYIYDEEVEGRPFSELTECPICKQPVSKFEPYGGETKAPAIPAPVRQATASSAPDYDPTFVRHDPTARYMDEIHEMAVTGESLHAAMGTLLPMPKWEDILLLGAQLAPPPLNDGEEVNVMTVIGKKAKQPMVLGSPVFISHMSFGALSKEAKTALSMGAAAAKTAMCSGEGGILPEERAAAYKYIFEYIPNKYSVTDENLKASDAIEIKIGQGTKPGMGGHLPGSKVTPEIAAVRGKPVGEDIQSPSKYPDINSEADLKALVDELRERSEGRPVGIKIAAGNLEDDLAFVLAAGPDFITIDGRGGATGSSPFFLREATSVPTIYALSRAKKYLDSVGSDVDLIITGGLRVSSDFAKALAMGADAIAVATGPMIALGCQQYRICGSGLCPVGIATQDPELRKRLDVDAGAKRVANYLVVSTEELKTFARISGVKDIHELSYKNLVTTSSDIADYTGIAHAGKSPVCGGDLAVIDVAAGNAVKYKCLICGQIFEIKEGDEVFCPLCHAAGDDLEMIPEGGVLITYKCLICGQTFEIREGDEVFCPLCHASGEDVVEA